MPAAGLDPRHGCLSSERRQSGRARALALAAGAFLAFAALAGPALAADRPVTVFMGVKVTPYPGIYVVQKDVNVRGKPDTKSNKIGSLQAGARIHAVAKTAGGWLAIRDGQTDVGFVHDSALLPLIDGTLGKDIQGNVQISDGPACAYVIRFEGKSQVEGQMFEIADYDVAWDCKLDGRALKFRTPMFITEASYQLNQKRIFQINVDVLDLFGGLDEILSTILLYDEDMGRVAFDSVTVEKYKRAPATKEAPAKTVAKALEGAVRIAASAWNKQAWSDLSKILQ
jgi:hypothetical protein